VIAEINFNPKVQTRAADNHFDALLATKLMIEILSGTLLKEVVLFARISIGFISFFISRFGVLTFLNIR